MEIIKAYPPNFDKIKQRFGNLPQQVVFAYGKYLYNPSGLPIPENLMVHEETHKQQQGGKVEDWWNRYLEDSQFRLDQEVEAYRNQYQYVAEHGNRDIKREFLRHIAQDLSGSIYGHLVTFEQAKQLITN